MATYGVIQNPPPWTNLTELGEEITVGGLTVAAVVNRNPVVGNIILGEAGFEAESPYVLVPTDAIVGLGDIHGAAVVIGSDNYVVRNVHTKHETNLTRIVLDAR